MDIITYALSKKIAAHAVSGVQSMSVNGQTLTINTKDSGVLTMTFPTPKDGLSVTDIDVNANNQIIFTMSDGSEIISGKIPTVKGDPFKYSDFTPEQLDALKGDSGVSPTITENADNTDKIYKLDIETIDGKFTTPNLRGADGTGSEGASKWSEISDKPFESLSTDFSVENGELKVVGGSGGSGEENTIESISVNGVNVEIDENKNVDITVPSTDGLATETYVDNKVADYTKTVDLADVATSGSYNDLADKPTIPSLDGYAKTSDIPAKVSELENDSNYLSSIPEEYVTDTELEAKGYLTEHQDISGKVDKVEGKSLISDTEIARLASVDNYDDTEIRAELANKADITAIPTVDVTKSYVDAELVKKADTDHTHTTVNGHTVESDVPENAVFTDTVLEINDADVSKTTVWSSDKVASEIASAIAGGEVDLSAYQKKNDTGLCTMAQDIVGAINEVKEAVDSKVNYDDTVVKADIAELKTKAHTHANAEVLNSITSENIQSWNNKSEFDGNYNTLTNKPTLPVKLSDLINDSGYITNIVDDLLNYYKKSDTYSKEEIAELIGNINKLTSEIVESLPIENISTSTIYLIKDGDTNNYKQYMYISGAWAQLSDTNIDLSGYAKLTDLDTKVDKVTGKTLSTNDFTNVLKSKLDGIAEGANKTIVDAELSTTSTNPVQNAVITTKINTLANKDGSNATGTWGIDISGIAAKATADKNGNDITTTYTKQSDFEKIVGNVDIIDYTSQISKNTNIISGMFSTNIRKVGHIVTFVINITVKAVSSPYVELGTIPEGVRPPANVSYNILTNKGDACYVYIDSNGKFGIRKISATEFVSNDGVRFCANYITEE